MTGKTTTEVVEKRRLMERKLTGRGIEDPLVLQAMGDVPREIFVPTDLRDVAYEDTPLPIAESQTISQPFIVARMLEILKVKKGDKVLEIGLGSGYAASVMTEMGATVYGIERRRNLFEIGQKNLRESDYHESVNTRLGDGSKGWPEEAPFDVILVSAGGPYIPHSLKEQLAIGGRLVMPVGGSSAGQQLVFLRKDEPEVFFEARLDPVKFVPLIGSEGWQEERYQEQVGVEFADDYRSAQLSEVAEIVDNRPESFDKLVNRLAEHRVVCIGESTHGTSEFYSTRAQITKELIEKHGFDTIALEADWSDTLILNNYIKGLAGEPFGKGRAFDRFPHWMWANEETKNFLEWARDFTGQENHPEKGLRLYGLDLYNLISSMNAVTEYLEEHDPELAESAKTYYGCLEPWADDPTAYGSRMKLDEKYKGCEQDVNALLTELLDSSFSKILEGDDELFETVQHAKVVTGAEAYYRTMFYGSTPAWNLRDMHMYETLQEILHFRGQKSKIVVWAHNSHVGDATVTQMGWNGKHNLGQLIRQGGIGIGSSALVGMGTHEGTVMAASEWGGKGRVETLERSQPGSWERYMHNTGIPSFVLPLHMDQSKFELARELKKSKLQRAIGVVYRPDTEIMSHYFKAVLGKQFDEFIWIDKTRAVKPLV